MVKPSKESAAAGGRAKVVAQNDAFTVQAKSVVTQIPLPNGERIVFPDNWHELNNHPKKVKFTGALNPEQRRHG